MLAPLALLVFAGVVAAVLVTGLHSATNRHSRAQLARPQRPAQTATRRQAGASNVSSSKNAAPQTPPTPVSSTLATELDARGHELLLAGRYLNAVPVLRRAMLATGQQLGQCLEPATNACLTYAYALYDLGRALRLGGDPGDAVPILEHRLEIDNQRPTVAAELVLARQQAG
jgi:hypothetical protein